MPSAPPCTSSHACTLRAGRSGSRDEPQELSAHAGVPSQDCAALLAASRRPRPQAPAPVNSARPEHGTGDDRLARSSQFLHLPGDDQRRCWSHWAFPRAFPRRKLLQSFFKRCVQKRTKYSRNTRSMAGEDEKAKNRSIHPLFSRPSPAWLFQFWL